MRKVTALTTDHKWQSFWVVSIGIFMSTLDGSILNIANPTIAQSLQVNMQQVQWVVTAYMLIITATLIFWGRLGDQIGSTRIYRNGFLMFTIGSLLCSFSPSLTLLILSRLIQGIGASMMMATGIGIVANAFPAQERGKALGLTGTVVGIGNMTGPSLGGFLVAHYNWPIIFLINVPIGLLGFALATQYLFEPAEAKTKPVLTGHDLPGTLTFALAVSLLVYSLSTAPNIQITLFLVSLGLLPLFIYMEKRAPRPMLDLELFKIKEFVYGNAMAMVVYITQTSVFFLLPFYMELMLDFPASFSGLLMTIPPVTMALTAPLAGSLSDKVGSSKILSFSLALLSCSYIVFSSLSAEISLLKLISGLALLGLGMGMFGSPNNSSILGSIPKEKAGYGGGFIATVRNLSFALGIAGSVSIFSIILAASQRHLPYTSAYIQASHTIYLIAAGIAITGFIFSWLDIKSKPLNQSADN
ncbi:Tetracycline resistance protein TetB/drug resistance transporter [Syntrophomonas zehnderi OL-4]|uniref:Tetracycline resistance protein TetB/drug resistance transporter n=1 Tax=Syntrophomonas zehnderi OL-4 TaxID=690567 RepID=A0A0E4C7D7_9FIRM|nr:MFS transporter [Syntrophomonas zehnderi]CFW97702.1 Tetracycline resistance protein TetB/drug resistance transporter [Syntrophomonas zehnderi OL-4]